MTVREMVRAMQTEMRHPGLLPERAREILVQLSSLYGNCLDEMREADHAYSVVLLQCLDANEAANRAKIRAQISPEYQRKREASDIAELVLESIRSIKVVLKSLESEMRELHR